MASDFESVGTRESSTEIPELAGRRVKEDGRVIRFSWFSILTYSWVRYSGQFISKELHSPTQLIADALTRLIPCLCPHPNKGRLLHGLIIHRWFLMYRCGFPASLPSRDDYPLPVVTTQMDPMFHVSRRKPQLEHSDLFLLLARHTASHLADQQLQSWQVRGMILTCAYHPHGSIMLLE